MSGAAASYLFVPATRLDRVEKACASPAHEVVVDLEDAVTADAKEAARAALAAFRPARPVHVRINGAGSTWHDDDLAAVQRAEWVNGVVVPKVEDGTIVADVAARLRGRAVVALVETARGLLAAAAIAAAHPTRLALGAADLAADLRVEVSDEVLAHPRAVLVVASAAWGLPGPLDAPTFQVGDAERVRRDAALARRLGMGGKLCIHPGQVPAVNEVFAAADEVAWARAVLAEAEQRGEGVFTFRGEMIDEPVLERARRRLGG